MKISADVIVSIETLRQAGEKPTALYAKVDDEAWFAIPPGMVDSFGKAGAVVRVVAELPN